MSDIVERLRGTADAFELAGAPSHLVLYMRAAADEITRLRGGGCARDQGTTQFCAEAARLAKDNEQLRAALEPFARLADRYDPNDGDSDELLWDQTALPTVGDLRRARAALGGGA